MMDADKYIDAYRNGYTDCADRFETFRAEREKAYEELKKKYENLKDRYDELISENEKNKAEIKRAFSKGWNASLNEAIVEIDEAIVEIEHTLNLRKLEK